MSGARRHSSRRPKRRDAAASAWRVADGFMNRLRAIPRAGEWWEYKLLPILAVFYGTALHLGVSLTSLWPAALIFLGAVVPGAAYVSIVNDLADRDEDAAAGKPNRMAGRPAWQAVLLVALPGSAGLAFAWHWRGDAPLLLAYLAAWTAFSLYSLPPVRLKARGLAGVLADASGAHLFPSLLAALLVFRHAGVAPGALWLTAVALWAASYGVRGILWHQLADLDADRLAGVRTFAQRRGPAMLALLARWLVFPLEIAGLAVLLWLVASPLPLLALAFYLFLVQRRVAVWEMRAVLVQPRPRYLILMVDYYDVLLPLALLAAAAVAHPLDIAVIAVHLLLFPKRASTVFHDAWRLRRGYLPRRPRPWRQNR